MFLRGSFVSLVYIRMYNIYDKVKVRLRGDAESSNGETTRSVRGWPRRGRRMMASIRNTGIVRGRGEARGRCSLFVVSGALRRGRGVVRRIANATDGGIV